MTLLHIDLTAAVPERGRSPGARNDRGSSVQWEEGMQLVRRVSRVENRVQLGWLIWGGGGMQVWTETDCTKGWTHAQPVKR